ncbi:hypothetical protein PTKIN_Ptkin02bG0219500 [Pterospermum kingtungense]
MADWSKLPPELLTLIAKRLVTRFDVIRFRSVCSSWRSLYLPRPYPLPKCLPSNTRGRYEYSQVHITRDTLYLVRLPAGADHTAAASSCWVVNIREYTRCVKVGLLKPLFDSKVKPLPLNFPKVFDLTNFQVSELGHQFAVQYRVGIDHPVEEPQYATRKKVALMWSGTNSDDDFMMLTELGCLVYFRSGEKEWTPLENLGYKVDDFISFNGKFYVIERNGRTVVVDQSLNVSFLEQFGSPTTKKLLVQSGDNLLVVEMPFLVCCGPDAQFPPNSSISVEFRIFRLDEEERKWNKMESLGDQILFLGLNDAISASASEFYWGKGNLIFYSRYLSFRPCYAYYKYRCIFVLDLETGTSTSLENCPAYCNLFRPPPEWITSPASVISSRQVISKPPERVSTAEQEVCSKRLSKSSKCNFKFCCF